MIIDVNAHLGHYPFRKLHHRTAAEVVELMDANGIDRAVVSSLHAAFYRDAHRGNEELYEETKPHERRFVAVATVNPRYVGWKRDLDEAVERWGMKAATLVPAHHGYALDDELGHAALARIAELGLPVVLTQHFEDRRQRHPWDVADSLQIKTVLKVAGEHPGLKFVLSNWAGLNGQALAEAGLKGRCLIDFARIQVIYFKDVPKLIAALGVESIAFGSHLPFDYVGPSLVKLANIGEADRERIAWRNAAEFFKIDV